jgi:hypothetical protein
MSDILKFQVPRKEVVLVQSSPLDQFLIEEIHNDPKRPPVIHFCNDVSMLFNQERLSREMGYILEDMVSRLRTSDLSDNFSHLSDDEIIDTVKSRYIQAPSELISWSKYIMANMDSLSEESKQEVVETLGGVSSDSKQEPSNSE